MNLEIIEQHQQQILEAFSQREFDQIEMIGEADEKEFFELCFREKLLARLAETMPTERKKEEVPLWFELAANLSLKLHWENSYSALERVVQGGGLLSALPPDLARKHLDAQTQQIWIQCRGFNDKNHYPRQDALRRRHPAQSGQGCLRGALARVVQRTGASGFPGIGLFRSPRDFRGRRHLSVCARQSTVRGVGGAVV
jgi:hypothetical protein